MERIGYTIFSFAPRSGKARRWVKRHIDAGEVRHNGGFYAENRCARDIAGGMQRDGLVVADRLVET